MLEPARATNPPILLLAVPPRRAGVARHCRERRRIDEARALLIAAHAWFANRPAAAPEIVAARRLLAELA